MLALLGATIMLLSRSANAGDPPLPPPDYKIDWYSIDGGSPDQPTSQDGEQVMGAIGQPDAQVIILDGNQAIDMMGGVFAPPPLSQGNTTTPTLSLYLSSSPEVAEGSGIHFVIARLSVYSDVEVTANIVLGGTATPGLDYYIGENQVTFAPYSLETSIAVEILQDTIDENDETIIITLGEPQGAEIETSSSIVLTILDDDEPPYLYIAEETYNRVFEFEWSHDTIVELSQASGKSIMASYETTDITAIEGENYRRNAGTIHFLPGETTKTISTAIIEDSTTQTLLNSFQYCILSAENAILEPSLPCKEITIVDGSPIFSTNHPWHILDPLYAENATSKSTINACISTITVDNDDRFVYFSLESEFPLDIFNDDALHIGLEIDNLITPGTGYPMGDGFYADLVISGTTVYDTRSYDPLVHPSWRYQALSRRADFYYSADELTLRLGVPRTLRTQDGLQNAIVLPGENNAIKMVVTSTGSSSPAIERCPQVGAIDFQFRKMKGVSPLSGKIDFYPKLRPEEYPRKDNDADISQLYNITILGEFPPPPYLSGEYEQFLTFGACHTVNSRSGDSAIKPIGRFLQDFELLAECINHPDPQYCSYGNLDYSTQITNNTGFFDWDGKSANCYDMISRKSEIFPEAGIISRASDGSLNGLGIYPHEDTNMFHLASWDETQGLATNIGRWGSDSPLSLIAHTDPEVPVEFWVLPEQSISYVKADYLPYLYDVTLNVGFTGGWVFAKEVPTGKITYFKIGDADESLLPNVLGPEGPIDATENEDWEPVDICPPGLLVKSNPAFEGAWGEQVLVRETDPINLFSGEFTLGETDISVPSVAGVGISFGRAYRAKINEHLSDLQGNPYRSRMGRNWQHSFDVWFERVGAPAQSSILLSLGGGVQRKFHQSGGKYVDSETNDSFVYNSVESELNFANGETWLFSSLDGRLKTMRNLNGASLDFYYESDATSRRINHILDPKGSALRFYYYSQGQHAGRLERVVNDRGGAVIYEYNEDDDLASVTWTAVDEEGIVTGIEGPLPDHAFPLGIKRTYTYNESGQITKIVDGRRNDPADPTYSPFHAYLENEYDSNGRVVRQVWGDGVVNITYVDSNDLLSGPYVQGDLVPPSTAAKRTILNDRNGHVKEFFFNESNHLVRKVEFSGKLNIPGFDDVQPTISAGASRASLGENKINPSDPDYFITDFEWETTHSALKKTVLPDGTEVVNTYDFELGPSDPGYTISPKRNLVHSVVRKPAFGGGFEDGGQGYTEIKWAFEYGEQGCSCGSRATRITDPEGNVIESEFDEFGNTLWRRRLIDGGYVTTDFEYDGPYHQLSAIVHPPDANGQRRRDEFEYLPNGVPDYSISGKGKQNYRTDREFDEVGFLRRTSNVALGLGGEEVERISTEYVTDPFGNVQTVHPPSFSWEGLIDEELDKVVIKPRMDIIYDANGNVKERRWHVDGHHPSGDYESPSTISQFYEYDILDNVVLSRSQVSDTPGDDIVTQNEYDKSGNLTRILKPNFPIDQYATIDIIYDERGLASRFTLADGSVELEASADINYTLNGQRSEVRFLGGGTDPDRISLLSYDPWMRVNQVTDPMGNETHIKYRKDGLISEVEVWGEVLDTDVTNANAVMLRSTLIEYDEMGRTQERRQFHFRPSNGLPILDGEQTSVFEYNQDSTISSVLLDNGTGIHYSYVGGELSGVADGVTDSETETFSGTFAISIKRDGMGRVSELAELYFQGSPEHFAIGKRISFDYNEAGLAHATHYLFDNEETSDYSLFDSIGRLRFAKGEKDRITEYRYDGLNRIQEIWQGGESSFSSARLVSSFEYNDLSQLLSATDPGGNVTQYEYDDLGRVTGIIAPDLLRTEFEYNSFHEVVASYDPSGSSAFNHYDRLGRVTSTSFTLGTEVHTDSSAILRGYNGVSELVWAEDEDSRVIREFDSLGNILSETQSFLDELESIDLLNGIVDPRTPLRSATVEREVTNLGLVTGLTYPGGRHIRYERDGFGRLLDVYDDQISMTVPLRSTPREGLVGRPLRHEFINGLVTTFRYGTPNHSIAPGVSRPTEIVTTAGTEIRSAIVSTFDEDLNLASRAESYDGYLGYPANEFSHRFNFAYDKWNRLASVEQDLGQWTSREYEFSEHGNLTGINHGGSTHIQFGPTSPDPSHRVLTKSIGGVLASQYSYDSRGNLIGESRVMPPHHQLPPPSTISHDFEYNVFNQLASAQIVSGLDPLEEVSFRYRHDAMGRRILKSDDEGGETWFLYDGFRVIEERNGENDVTATYVHGDYIDELVSMQRRPDGNSSFQDFFYHQDGNYNVVGLSDTTGDFVERIRYSPYGQPTHYDGTGDIIYHFGLSLDPDYSVSLIGNPYAFTGQRWDGELGWYHYRLRHYSPSLARFVSKDPIGAWGDHLNRGNPYTYVGNNPWNFLDPFGLEATSSYQGGGFGSGFCRGLEDSVFAYLALAEYLATTHPSTSSNELLDGFMDSLGAFFEKWLLASDLRIPLSETWNSLTPENVGETLGGATPDLLLSLIGMTGARYLKKADLPVRNTCFVAGTLVLLGYGLLPIEEVEIGDLVPSPEYAHSPPDLDGLLVVVKLESVDSPFATASVTLLRPMKDVQGLEVGRITRLDWGEEALTGYFMVLEISPAEIPILEPGSTFVSGLFVHENAQVLNLYLGDSDLPLSLTSTHPVFSVDRNLFVPAGDLREGEEVDCLAGSAYVTEIKEVPGFHIVYNIEVAGSHQYRVGNIGLLVHNKNGRGRNRGESGDFSGSFTNKWFEDNFTEGRFPTSQDNATEHWKKHQVQFPELENQYDYFALVQSYREDYKRADFGPDALFENRTKRRGEKVVWDKSFGNTFVIFANCGRVKTVHRFDPLDRRNLELGITTEERYFRYLCTDE